MFNDASIVGHLHEDLASPTAVGTNAGNVILQVGREVGAAAVVKGEVAASALEVPVSASVDVTICASLLRSAVSSRPTMLTVKTLRLTCNSRASAAGAAETLPRVASMAERAKKEVLNCMTDEVCL